MPEAKQKFLKVVMLDATFPELKTGAMYQRGKGVASTVRAAAARAMGDLLKQPKVKGKRFSTIKLTMSIGQKAVEETMDKPNRKAIEAEEEYEASKYEE